MAKPAPRQTSNLPVNYAEQLANEVKSIQSRIATPSGDRIRMKNNSHFVLPDGTEAPELEGVIVDFVSSNLFFDSAFDKDNPSVPACFAVGLEETQLVPTGNSPDKQADTCASCVNNQYGSAGKGKACKNTILVAFRGLEEGSETHILSVPPTSLKPFKHFVGTLNSKHRLPPVGVLTRISLDKSVDFAAPRFDVIRPLTNEELPLVMEDRDQVRERLSAEPDFSQYKPPARAGGSRGAPAPQARRGR